MRKRKRGLLFFLIFLITYINIFIVFSQSSTINLIAKSPLARWRNDRGLLNLPFPGNPNDSRGFVRIIKAQLENGEFANNVLQTHPRWAPGGSIEGQFQITIPDNAKFSAEVGFIQGATGTDGVIFEILWREKGERDIVLGRLEKKYTGQLALLNVELQTLAGRSGFLVLKVEAGASSAQDWAIWKSAVITVGPPERPVALPGAKEKEPVITPTAKVTKPVVPTLALPAKDIKEAIKRINRYKLTASLFPTETHWEIIVDEMARSFYFKIILPKSEFKGIEVYQVASKAYGRRLDNNIWFNIQTKPEVRPILTFLATMLEQGEAISSQTEGQLIRYEFRQKDDPLSKNPKEFFESVARNSAEELSRKIIDISADLKSRSYLWISAKDKKIKKIMQEVESRRIKTTSIIEIEEVFEKIPSPPLEALNSKSPEIPFYFLLMNVRADKALGGYDNYMHCTLANESIRLIYYSDKEKMYEEIYEISQPCDCSKYKFKEKSPSPNESDHPILIGTYYEDIGQRPDFYLSWLGDEYKDFINIPFPAMRHYGGGVYGLEYRIWYELWAIVGYGGSIADIHISERVPDRPCQGNRYYSAREWGYGGSRNGEGTCSTPVEAANRLTFIEAIKQYSQNTLQGKKNAYLMIGHVMHLLHDQSEPDHALLVPHPGSGASQIKAARDFQVCMLCAVLNTIPWCQACFGRVPLLSDLGCLSLVGLNVGDAYLPNNLLISLAEIAANPCLYSIYSYFELACRESIEPCKVGFEWLPDDDRYPADSKLRPDNLIWRPSRIESEIRRLGAIRRTNYDDFFQTMADYAVEAVKRHGFSSDYENGNSLGTSTWTCPPLPIPASKPNIDLTDTRLVERYLSLIDDLSKEAICLGAGLLEYFYEIVNPPPYVSRVIITQNSEIRYDMHWDDVINGTKVVKRTWGGKNYTLYHGVPADISIWFGPYSADGSIEGKSRKMRPGRLYLDSAQTPLRVEREGKNWLLKSNFLTPCVNQIEPILKNINLDTEDDAPHLYSRVPIGNRLDKNPETIAYADFNYPYNWVNYETDRLPYSLPDQIKIGIPPAFIDFEWDRIIGTDTHYSDEHNFPRLIVRYGATVTVPMKFLEQESNELIKTGERWEKCGRYYFYLSPTIDLIGQGRHIIPTNGGFTIIPERHFDEPIPKSYDEAGLSISVDSSYSNAPTISIQVSENAPNGLYQLPISLKYQFNNGGEIELYNAYITIQVRDEKQASEADRAGGKIETLLQGKEIAKFRKMGFLDIRGNAPKAFDPCAQGVASPEWCFQRDPLKLSSFQIVANNEAVFISSDGEVKKMKVSDLGFNIRREEGSRQIIFRPERQLSAGVYIFSFRVMMGNKKIDEFQLMAYREK